MQNWIGILGYGCIYACAWICNKSQIKSLALFSQNTRKIIMNNHGNTNNPIILILSGEYCSNSYLHNRNMCVLQAYVNT